MDLPYWSRWKNRLIDVSPDILQSAENLIIKISSLDIKKAELVLLEIENPVLFAAAYFHLLETGATPIILSRSQKSPQNVSVRYKIFDEGLSKVSPTLTLAPYPQSFATFSSGSTGDAKIFYHSINSAKQNAKMHAKALGIQQDSCIYQTLPTSHIFGVIAYLWTPIETQCGLLPSSFYLGLRDLAKQNHSSSVIHLTPHQVESLKNDSFAFKKCFDKVSVGAGVLSTENARFLLTKICKRVFVTYGLTEAGPRVTCGEIFLDTMSSYNLGHPLEGIEVKIVQEGRFSSAGEGLLAIKSPCLALNLEDSISGGYLITPDLVRLEPSGRLTILGRQEDFLKIGGHRISRQTIESDIKALGEIEDICVLQVFEDGDEKIRVYVKTKLSEKDVSNKISQNLPLLRKNSEVIIISDMPRTALGKVDRQKLIKGDFN